MLYSRAWTRVRYRCEIHASSATEGICVEQPVEDGTYIQVSE
jgi:hypothetical protein